MIRLYLICLLLLSWMNYIHAKENILIARRKGKEFKVVFDSIKNEIQNDFNVHEYIIRHFNNYNNFVDKVISKKIDLLVLMDNQAINYGKRLKFHKDPKIAKLNAVALMGLNINNVLKEEEYITGVNYEVPPFTIITSFRKLVKQPIKKVQVFYRPSKFSNEANRAKLLLQAEGINLELINVEQNGKSLSYIIKFLKRNLRKKIVGSNSDAILVLSDSVLLNQKSFLNDWIPASRSIKKPFLCGIESLTSIGINFCTFAASPDHLELGEQVSQLIYSILEEKEKIQDLQIEQILSVEKTLNMKKINWMKMDMDHSSLNQIKVLR
ncbi:MAG: hypothetical protein KC646_11950 [Candidatus Cloacimonetes bacterium]|nr:hypothetical protein [Candidatus Cloacimonadota bacterium]